MEKTTKENMDKQYKIVFNAGIVRELIRRGVPIYDIKADKTNPDKTVFVFKKDDAFNDAFSKINEEIKSRKESTDVVL